MFFKRNNIDVLKIIKEYHKELSDKCDNAYRIGDVNSGRWWDCQACAMILLEKRINELKNGQKNVFKERKK